MNNDEFIGKLSDKLSLGDNDVTDLVASLSDIFMENLQNGKKISLNDFGVFEVEKVMEHIIVNPSDNRRILVPPSLEVSFNPSESLIKKMNI